MFRAVLCAAALLLGGCAHEYIYAPENNVTGALAGRPAARYPIPGNAPHGSVEVASFGVSDVGPAGTSYRALHVRMIVENDGAIPWSLDTREQLATIAGEGDSRPAFVNADSSDVPLLTIGAGQRRVVDLFYPLPATLQSARRIAEFDLKWSVRTDGGVVAERTSFERLRVEPAYAATYVAPYSPVWTVHWWYDPYYPRVAFIHRPWIVMRAPRVFVVGRPRL